MKKLILAMMVAVLPLCMNAQSKGLLGRKTAKVEVDNSAYMQGAIPTVDGKVVFSKTINAQGKSKSDLYKALAQWSSFRYAANTERGLWNDPDYFKNLEYAAVKDADSNAAKIVCQGNEEIVFSNRILAKDASQFNYILDIDIKDGTVVATISNIAYVYNLTEEPQRLTAEEWITDEVSFTKKGKAIKSNLKFRIKTVDTKDEIFEEIETAIK